MHRFDITAVINGHREGLLAPTSLRSMAIATDFAAKAGYSVQLLAILDRPDALTREVFQSAREARANLEIIEVDRGDLGHARNDAVSRAAGRYAAFLDADDLWSKNWLTEAARLADNDTRDIVWHPEINVYFGTHNHVVLHRGMEHPRFKLASLAHTNLWTALSFVSTELLRRIPYASTDLKNNIGFEDWSWNVEIIKRGGLHKIVPGTSHAIRTKPISLLSQTNAAQCIPLPTDYFRSALPT